MSDIVEELRTDFKPWFKDGSPYETIYEYEKERHEAADEIERLRAQVAALREALTEDDIEFSLRQVERRDDQANTYALDRASAAAAKGETG